MFRRRRNRARPHDVRIPSHAQSGQQINPDVAVARVLHGTEQRHDNLDGHAAEAASVNGASSLLTSVDKTNDSRRNV